MYLNAYMYMLQAGNAENTGIIGPFYTFPGKSMKMQIY